LHNIQDYLQLYSNPTTISSPKSCNPS